MSKPFRLAEVVETCRRILGGARPLQGRPQPPPEEPEVEVRDAADKLLGVGTLMDMATRGAQVDLERPLMVAQRVTLVVHEGPTWGATTTRRSAGSPRWKAATSTACGSCRGRLAPTAGRSRHHRPAALPARRRPRPRRPTSGRGRPGTPGSVAAWPPRRRASDRVGRLPLAGS